MITVDSLWGGTLELLRSTCRDEDYSAKRTDILAAYKNKKNFTFTITRRPGVKPGLKRTVNIPIGTNAFGLVLGCHTLQGKERTKFLKWLKGGK